MTSIPPPAPLSPPPKSVQVRTVHRTRISKRKCCAGRHARPAHAAGAGRALEVSCSWRRRVLQELSFADSIQQNSVMPRRHGSPLAAPSALPCALTTHTRHTGRSPCVERWLPLALVIVLEEAAEGRVRPLPRGLPAERRDDRIEHAGRSVHLIRVGVLGSRLGLGLGLGPG